MGLTIAPYAKCDGQKRLPVRSVLATLYFVTLSLPCARRDRFARQWLPTDVMMRSFHDAAVQRSKSWPQRRAKPVNPVIAREASACLPQHTKSCAPNRGVSSVINAYVRYKY